jgi:hypothetical protein
MSDGHVIADQERMGIVRDMQHAKVLDIRAMPNPDDVDVAPDDGVEPDAAIFAHADIADDHRRVFNKTGLRDGRPDALEGTDHSCTLGEPTGFAQALAVRLTGFLAVP